MESGAPFHITQAFNLTLYLVAGGLHYGWRCLHEETNGKQICQLLYDKGESMIGKAMRTEKGMKGGAGQRYLDLKFLILILKITPNSCWCEKLARLTIFLDRLCWQVARVAHFVDRLC